MSSTTMYTTNDDDEMCVELGTFPNSYGWGPYVWRFLGERHGVGGGIHDWERLWDGVKAGAITLEWWEYNVLFATYDNAVVKGENLPVFIRSLEKFDVEFNGTNHSHVAHVRDIAKILRDRLSPQSSLEKHGPVAFHGSLTDDPWMVYDGETDEETPYNLNTGDKHWFVEIKDPT